MKIDIVRAWKDASYRSNLGTEELARLPEHPAGALELDDVELNEALGGTWWTPLTGITPDLSPIETMGITVRVCCEMNMQ